MRIPINWLNELVTIPKDFKSMTDRLTMVGHMLDKTTVINGEAVIDLELRGNRADCYSILGIAREVSAMFNSKLKLPQKIDLANEKKLKNITLKIDSHLVNRAAIVEIFDIKIKSSPKWLRDRLVAYGMESINNIVDLTNYVMIETGQPMHAWDLDKLTENEIEVRLARTGEQIVTFQGLNTTLTNSDLVWAMGKNILAVAGGIGEKYHSISDTTQNILIEAANYNRASIRKTIYRHNLLTESGLRQEKELDPNLVEMALGRFLYLIKKNKWGNFNLGMHDYYPNPSKPWQIELNIKKLNDLAGFEIPLKEAEKILISLNFQVISKNKDKLVILVPTFRTDVKIEEDLIEEVLRIIGYDQIPVKTLSLEIPKPITPEFVSQEENLRHAAASVGFDEVISLPFVSEKMSDLNCCLDMEKYEAAVLVNPPSPDTKYLRRSMFPNLLSNTQKIMNERGEIASLFEIGKIYGRDKNKYFESRKIGLTYWTKENKGFINFKSLVLSLLSSANLPDVLFEASKNEILKNSYFLIINGNKIGVGGQYDDIYFLELNLEELLGKTTKYKASLWPKFPPQIEDITLVLPYQSQVGELVNEIKLFDETISNVELKDVYNDSYTFRIWYQSPAKTLENWEIEKVRSKLISTLSKKFGASVK